MDNEISALKKTVSTLIKQGRKDRNRIKGLQDAYDNIMVCLRRKDEVYEILKGRIGQTEYDITKGANDTVQLADKVELIEEILEDTE